MLLGQLFVFAFLLFSFDSSLSTVHARGHPLRVRSTSEEAKLQAAISKLRTEIASDTSKANSLRTEIALAKHKKETTTVNNLNKSLGALKKTILQDDADLAADKKSLAKLVATSSTHAPSTVAASKSTKTTSKPATTTIKAIVSVTATTTSKKKGLGYNTASFTTAFGNSLSFAYNWADSPDGTLLASVEYFPMLWGSSTTGWQAAAEAAINAGSSHLLGMNEPDNGGQSNLTPAQAVAEWKAQMEPFFNKATLISPAITNGGAPAGVAWMSEFIELCTGCHIQGIAAHWYDSATNIAYFQNYFTDMYNTFKLPIYITEFAGSGTVAQQQSFFKTIIPWMESQSYIARYAAFGDFAGTFVNSDGSLTSLGQTYKDTV